MYADGFENSKLLAQKCVRLNSLCHSQCRSQIPYDFGLRALRTILYKAGDLKRIKPDQPEEMTLIRAIRDTYGPQFDPDDLLMFEGILEDLFPGIDVQESQQTKLRSAIERCMEEKNLANIESLIIKHVQLYELMSERTGILLLGGSGSGKTTIYNTLADSLAYLEVAGGYEPIYKRANIQCIAPNSFSLDELYGTLDNDKLEWLDGLLSKAIRGAANTTEEIHQWIILDGNINSEWIENLNLILDDNKLLTLSNNERIKIPHWVHIIFEIDDLSKSCPSIISRCGMVYINHRDLKWNNVVSTWLNSFNEQSLNADVKDFLKLLFDKYFEQLLSFTLDHSECFIKQLENSKVKMFCTIFANFLKEIPSINTSEIIEAKRLLFKIWVWTALWSLGSDLTEDGKEKFENYLRNFLQKNDYENLPTENLWNLYIDHEIKDFEKWEKLNPKFEFSRNARFLELHVPTVDTIRYGYVAEILMQNEHSIMFAGPIGVGKTSIAKETFENISNSDISKIWINFSAKSSSSEIQTMIEGKLEKRKNTLLGAPIGKKIIIFVDDVSLPKTEAPIELLRQFLNCKGFYNRKSFVWRDVVDVSLSVAYNPSGQKLCMRFIRHFALLGIPNPTENAMNCIVGNILHGFFSKFVKSILSLTDPMTSAAVSIYQKVLDNFLPSPTKSHYMFNLRDLLKCVHGILQTSPSCYNTASQMLRLFYHESLRVYHDRLVDNQDKNLFKDLLKQVCMK